MIPLFCPNMCLSFSVVCVLFSYLIVFPFISVKEKACGYFHPAFLLSCISQVCGIISKENDWVYFREITCTKVCEYPPVCLCVCVTMHVICACAVLECLCIRLCISASVLVCIFFIDIVATKHRKYI